MPNDLLTKSGLIFCPGQGINGVLDIATNGTGIGAVEPYGETFEAPSPRAWPSPETQ